MDEAERLLSLARTLLTRGGTLESTDSGEAIDPRGSWRPWSSARRRRRRPRFRRG